MSRVEDIPTEEQQLWIHVKLLDVFGSYHLIPRVPETNNKGNISETNGEWHKPSTQKYVIIQFY